MNSKPPAKQGELSDHEKTRFAKSRTMDAILVFVTMDFGNGGISVDSDYQFIVSVLYKLRVFRESKVGGPSKLYEHCPK